MIYDLAHGDTALLVIDVQGEYFDPDRPAFVPAGTATLPRGRHHRPDDEFLLRDDGP